MKHNNAWAFKQIKPYLGNAILEVGAGIGNISKFLTPLKKNVTLIDVNADYLEYLRYRFIGNPKVKVLCHDIASRGLSNLAPLKIDTIICMNVLEHIEDDNLVLENFYNI
ncbi:MAG: class I SAM-dependent methyltransferase, partial [Candidatus Omnitrophica bacterium]|nr:class I SAM-dependent methyltransferase [Candidatus Omnitrophota bacterium]